VAHPLKRFWFSGWPLLRGFSKGRRVWLFAPLAEHRRRSRRECLGLRNDAGRQHRQLHQRRQIPFGAAGTLLGSPNLVHYNAAGAMLTASLGNGINETRTYDGRLRLAGITDGSVYALTIPTSGGYAGNGNVLTANDSVNGNWTYSYDAFNRLVSASKTGQSYTYGYDRFGNRWTVNGSGPGFDANNHIIPGMGVAYDTSGDTTNDGTLAYTYDAESRIVTAGALPATYTTPTASE
jgi:YD repeat-containing protein